MGEITGNHKKHAQVLPMHRNSLQNLEENLRKHAQILPIHCRTIQYLVKLITKPWKEIKNHAKILRHLVKTERKLRKTENLFQINGTIEINLIDLCIARKF